jgi:cytoskeletal protein CcmA (bactofilin family)
MPTTVITAGTHLEGGLRSKDDLHVEGRVDGAIVGEAAVEVAEGAQVGGDVWGREVTIAGVLRQNVHATSAVHLLATAEVYGDIVAPRITVEDGAVLEGNVKITRTAPAQLTERRAASSPMRQPLKPAIVTAAVAARAIPELPALGRRVAVRRKA